MTDKSRQEFDGLTLVVPDKRDVERDAVCEQWRRHSGSVVRLGRFWEPPPLDAANVRLYGPDTFCLVLAQKLGIELVCPDDALLANLSEPLVKRKVVQTTLSQIGPSAFPLFVKPVVPKVFRALVYDSLELLQAECKGLEADTAVLISEPVDIVAEARCFILDRAVATCSVYEGEGRVADAIDVAKNVASKYRLPRTCVIDLMFIESRGWAVLEFNSTWGAGLNSCDPHAVASCILHATSKDK